LAKNRSIADDLGDSSIFLDCPRWREAAADIIWRTSSAATLELTVLDTLLIDRISANEAILGSLEGALAPTKQG